MTVTLTNQLVAADILRFDNIDFFRVLPVITVTSHPVEGIVGGVTNVSDHAQKQPLTLVFRGRITATPFGKPAPGGLELATAWFERNEGKLINVASPVGLFSGFIVTRYDYGKEGRDDRVFDVTAREIRLALGVSVPIPPRLPNPVAEVGSASPTNVGTQPPTTGTPPPPADVSGLETLARAAGA